MDNIIVITQNVKLDSLHLLRGFIKPDSKSVIFSTQQVFDNEAIVIKEQIGGDCEFVNFSSIMNDSDFARCDEESYSTRQEGVSQYYGAVKHAKNAMAVQKMVDIYPCDTRLLVCDDLGIDDTAWLDNGFKKVDCKYYHIPEPLIIKGGIKGKIGAVFNQIKKYYQGDIYITKYKGVKHLFFGSLNRIGYRMDLAFKKASKWENIKYIFQSLVFKRIGFFPKNKTIRMSTLHESISWGFPKCANANIKIIQDGYLPPNYSSKYLLFNGPYVEFYTWDVEGQRTFEFFHLKNRVMPFRKKLYLPKPVFPQIVKKVLCVASGAGDWTAVKNRSDEDKMMIAFGKVAALFPNIEFVYRCHPVWIHPQHQGVNSINRAAEYIHWLNLPNLKISSNIPNAEEGGRFRLSYKRSSFEEDLKDVDIVFGEHSISMIDAAFKNILFCSVNVTGRRDLFSGISEMGFPHCENVEEIVDLINKLPTDSFRASYNNAVKSYNEMTNKESVS